MSIHSKLVFAGNPAGLTGSPMIKKPHKPFLDFIKKAFGKHDNILRHTCAQGGAEVCVYVFRNCPEPGMITGVTYGLSLAPMPGAASDSARRELIISVESEDALWAWNAAYFAAEHRGLRPFSPGEVYFAEEPLAKDTTMEGLLVYTTSILPPDEAWVKVPGYYIEFAQLYPLHRSEMLIYERYGFQQLWNHPGFEIYNPQRAPMVI